LFLRQRRGEADATEIPPSRQALPQEAIRTLLWQRECCRMLARSWTAHTPGRGCVIHRECGARRARTLATAAGHIKSPNSASRKSVRPGRAKTGQQSWPATPTAHAGTRLRSRRRRQRPCDGALRVRFAGEGAKTTTGGKRGALCRSGQPGPSHASLFHPPVRARSPGGSAKRRPSSTRGPEKGRPPRRHRAPPTPECGGA